MRPARAVLMLAGLVMFIGALWSASDDRIYLSGDDVGAHDLGVGRVHLPVVARDAPVGGGPSDPMPWRPDADFVIGGPAWTVDVVGDVAFVGVGAHLMAYDISGEVPLSPLSLLGASPPLPGNVRDVVVSDGFAFAAVHQTTELADAPGGLFVLDVRDPSAMEVVATRELRGGATNLDLHEDHVVVTAMREWFSWPEGAAFVVFDISRPENPDLVRQAPKGSFSEGDITLIDDLVFACSKGSLLAFDTRLTVDSWLVGRDLAPCAAVARLGTDRLLAVVSDSSSPADDPPMLRILDVRDPTAVETIGEVPLDAAADPGVLVEVNDATVVGANVYVAAVIDAAEGRILRFDVSDPAFPTSQAAWSSDGAMLSVDHDGGAIVTGAASNPAEYSLQPFGDFSPAFRYNVFGSRVEVLDDAGDGSLRSLAKVDGPGTLLSTVVCHDETAYVFDIGPVKSDYGNGRLWAFHISDGMPGVKAVMDFPAIGTILDAGVWLDVGAWDVVASSSGLFVLNHGRISHYRVQEGRIDLIGTVADEGTLASSGDNLFVLSDMGELHAYDVSSSDAWRRVAALELPGFGPTYYGPHAMIASKNRLWMTTTIEDPFSASVILVDISDITDIKSIGTLDLSSESAGPEFAWLSKGDEAVWLMTTDWEHRPYRTTISTLSESPDGSGAVIDARWVSSATRESRVFHWALAVLEERAWYVSAHFAGGRGSVHAVEKMETGHLKLAGTRAAPAAVRARSTDIFDHHIESRGALSLAACGDRIFGTDLEGGLYGIDPERWLEDADPVLFTP